MAEFAEWDGFYGIVGSAAGTLIGLQFVVMTLVAERPPLRPEQAASAFGTPTIVHFGAALLLSALLRAPWHAVAPIAALWGCVGLAGVVYACFIGRRMGRQEAYQPDLEDWVFHVAVPLATYAALVPLAFASSAYTREVLFGVAAVALLLLFTGIHNAWDSVVYHVLVHRRKPEDAG
jgi:hypothetical protein